MDEDLKKMLDLADHLGFVDETEEDFSEFDDKVIALAQHFDIEEDYDEVQNIENLYSNEDYYSYSNQEFLVLTDDEADDRLTDYLKDLLDETVYSEIPDHLQSYFDKDAWLHDAAINGRGHFLALYDGNEEEETVNGVYYYIYRTN